MLNKNLKKIFVILTLTFCVSSCIFTYANVVSSASGGGNGEEISYSDGNNYELERQRFEELGLSLPMHLESKEIFDDYMAHGADPDYIERKYFSNGEHYDDSDYDYDYDENDDDDMWDEIDDSGIPYHFTNYEVQDGSNLKSFYEATPENGSYNVGTDAEGHIIHDYYDANGRLFSRYVYDEDNDLLDEYLPGFESAYSSGKKKKGGYNKKKASGGPGVKTNNTSNLGVNNVGPVRDIINNNTQMPSSATGGTVVVNNTNIINSIDVNEPRWIYNDMTGKWGLTTAVDDRKNVFLRDTMYNDAKLSKTYYFDNNGNMATGWCNTSDGKIYYFDISKGDNEGMMAKGITTIGNEVFVFDENGVLVK